MSAFKQKNAIASTYFNGFGGIDSTAPLGDTETAYDMVNFRILADGSLSKRRGFYTVASCPEPIRAIWSGDLDGEEITLIVYGNTVATVNAEEKTLTTIGQVESGEGKALFIFFDANLFLMDKHRFYSVTKSKVSTFDGYAPLYGKDWISATRGEMNEPLNLTSRRIRMTYNVTEPIIFLSVDHVVTSIDAVYLNGNLITDTSKYFFDNDLMCVCVVGLSTGDRVELYLTIDSSELDSDLLYSCRQAVVYGGYTDNRLFLWGGERDDLMYGSTSIDKESLEECKKVYTNTVPIYLPPNAAYRMGREGRRITAVCRQYDRLLIFTDGDTWTAYSPSGDAEPLNAFTVNTSSGCYSDGAALLCENDPVCVSRGTILRWSAETDELNECNCYSISLGIDGRLPQSFYKNAVIMLDRSRNEILFSDPEDESETLWIYNYRIKKWYRFDGIGAHHLFMCAGRQGFVKNNSVYLFDDSLGHDVLEDGSERKIVAYYQTHPTDFSVIGKRKRLCGFTLSAELEGGSICAEFISDEDTLERRELSAESTHPNGRTVRLNSPRFHYLTLRLSSSAEEEQRIYSLGVMVKP